MKSSTAPITSAEKRTTLCVATLTSFMGPFMISSINIALPDIQKEFSVNAVLCIMGMVLSAYRGRLRPGATPKGGTSA